MRSLFLVADRIEVRDHLVLPGVNISAWAREVAFLSGGSIDLTPIPIPGEGIIATNGSVGSNGATLEIYAQNLSWAPDFHVILQGGKGQKAGMANFPLNGNSYPVQRPNSRVSALNDCIYVYFHYNGEHCSPGFCNTCQRYDTRSGTKACPSPPLFPSSLSLIISTASGRDAASAAYPGRGGLGGQLRIVTSSQDQCRPDLASLVDVVGGSPGLPATVRPGRGTSFFLE